MPASSVTSPSSAPLTGQPLLLRAIRRARPYDLAMVGSGRAAKEPPPKPSPTMPLTAAQGRFGVDYLQLACAHAGFGCTEPRPLEDVQAIDATVSFEYGVVQVQVKCTTKAFSPKRQTIRIDIEEGWRESWAKLNVLSPVYL